MDRQDLAAVAVGLGTFLLGALAADGQTPSPVPEWEYAAGVALLPYVDSTGAPRTWDLTIGGAAELAPSVPGDSRYRVNPYPFFDLRYRTLAFASVMEGLGINLLYRKGMRAGVALTYDLGRDAGRDDRLHDLGDVNWAPEIKLFAEYVLFPVVLRADVRRALGGYDGVVADLGAYAPVLALRRLTVLVGPSVTYESSHYQQSYYGISTEQASKTGFPDFTPANNLIGNIRVGTTVEYDLTRHFALEAQVGVERFVGSVTASPLVRSDYQEIVGTYFTYEF